MLRLGAWTAWPRWRDRLARSGRDSNATLLQLSREMNRI
ncbi:hypothetical protein GWL_09810 [Herbaspirillum sp. GW103]|nr:hypothetical protein GWL_09810 [Herbaspirillum sp. GW103]